MGNYSPKQRIRMSDAWEELQALKSKRDSRRKRLEERKKERQDFLRGGNPIKTETSSPRPPQGGGELTGSSSVGVAVSPGQSITEPPPVPPTQDSSSSDINLLKKEGESFVDWECLEEGVLQTLSDVALHLPIDSRQLLIQINKTLSSAAQHNQITNLLQKFAVQLLISIEEKVSEEGAFLEIISADHTKLSAMITGDKKETAMTTTSTSVLSSSSVLLSRKRKAEESWSEDQTAVSDLSQVQQLVGQPDLVEKKPKENDVLSLLSLASTREKENKRIGEEILELLSRPSAKEKTLAERFRSQGGNVVKEFCPQGTKSECRRVSANNKPCSRLHFRKIIQSHTDESLGDCSFLNTCFHMETCKYVHYEVDSSDSSNISSKSSQGISSTSATTFSSSTAVATAISRKENLAISENSSNGLVDVVDQPKSVLFSPQWVFCDLRYFDMTVLGKFSVIMADPPWDIHMELPYGTLSDDEMRHLNIPALQDEGLIFLWVTGRAMELGRECLELWGYERVDELIWVKTNQLQRIIRTGRTGHWLNHGKEHCLVGMKGNPPVNRGLDCDVIVAEVRATSHKPDEIYGIIERLSPGTRKIELFGRPHNIQPNWITLGNQLEGSHIVDDEVRARFFTRYPDGNCCTVVKAK